MPAAIAFAVIGGYADAIGYLRYRSFNTTFITGDILRFAEGLTRRRSEGEPAAGEGFAIFGWVWLAYALGAALGIAACRLIERPLLLPIALLGFVYAWERLHPSPKSHNPS
ncbi:MAG: DUF1275 family protein [Stellaceae bacterium]